MESEGKAQLPPAPPLASSPLGALGRWCPAEYRLLGEAVLDYEGLAPHFLEGIPGGSSRRRRLIPKTPGSRPPPPAETSTAKVVIEVKAPASPRSPSGVVNHGIFPRKAATDGIDIPVSPPDPHLVETLRKWLKTYRPTMKAKPVEPKKKKYLRGDRGNAYIELEIISTSGSEAFYTPTEDNRNEPIPWSSQGASRPLCSMALTSGATGCSSRVCKTRQALLIASEKHYLLALFYQACQDQQEMLAESDVNHTTSSNGAGNSRAEQGKRSARRYSSQL